MSTNQDQAKVSTATPTQPIAPAVDVAPAPKSASDSASKPRPHDAAGPAPKTATPTKSVSPEPATTKRVQNPTYIDAVDDLARHFRRAGEVANLLGRAADNGLDAFKIYSSAEYNKSSSIAFALFKIALDGLPAAAALSELISGTKLAQKLAKIDRLASAAATLHKAKSAVERGAKTAETAKKVLDVAEAVQQPGEATEARTEAQERGDFELEAIHSLADLQVDALEKRWQGEDKARATLRNHEYEEGFDLAAVVSDAMKDDPLPDIGQLKSTMTVASERFELQLYLDYYITSGRVTYETVDTEGTVTEHFQGLPDKVRKRLFEHFNARVLVLNSPGLKREHRTHTYTGHMQ